MDTCKTCKFWETERTPARSGMPKGAGQCCCEKIRDTNDDMVADELVYQYYESGRFWSGPDFGCVHHQKKPS